MSLADYDRPSAVSMHYVGSKSSVLPHRDEWEYVDIASGTEGLSQSKFMLGRGAYADTRVSKQIPSWALYRDERCRVIRYFYQHAETSGDEVRLWIAPATIRRNEKGEYELTSPREPSFCNVYAFTCHGYQDKLYAATHANALPCALQDDPGVRSVQFPDGASYVFDPRVLAEGTWDFDVKFEGAEVVLTYRCANGKMVRCNGNGFADVLYAVTMDEQTNPSKDLGIYMYTSGRPGAAVVV